MSASLPLVGEKTRDALEAAATPSSEASGLSLFDQLKNSVDHNSVTKTLALPSFARDDKLSDHKCQDVEDQSDKSDSDKEDARPFVEPEFQPPKLPPSAAGTGAISGLGPVSCPSKRSSPGGKFALKPPSASLRDFAASPRSLKRSQTQPAPKASAGIAATAAAAAAVTASDAAAINQNAKKKRCTDRYDSSESSDSGVATSLSCTDSSTGSSEDASEPDSPYSPQSSLSEDPQSQHCSTRNTAASSSSSSKMSPQTILVSSASGSGGNATGSTANGQANTAVTTSLLPGSASLNAALRSTNLPASLTITPTNGGGGGKPKLPIAQVTKSSNTANANRCSNLPTLQWPWSTTNAASSAVVLPPPSPSSASSTAISPPTTASTGTNTLISHTAAAAFSNANAAKKRIAPNGIAADASLNAKKVRTNTSSQSQDAAGVKRLKAAALEESQTKITGYFKSQMKAQIHAANAKASTNLSPASSSSMILTNTTSSTSSSSVTLPTNALTLSAPATTASLNKYFNILAQLKENNKANNSSLNQTVSAASSVAVAAAPTLVQAPVPAPVFSSSATVPQPITITTTATPPVTPAVTITPSKTPNLAPQPVAMPALKKIERPKPTKIAQVAPNLRKGPTNQAYANLSNGSGKSPAKKHVAIAPRTPEMKQQQQQQQSHLAAKTAESGKQMSSTATQMTAPGTPTSVAGTTPQPAMLLTAIRLPPGQQQTTAQAKQQMPSNKMGTAPHMVPTTSSNAVTGPPTPSPVANAPAPAATLYQLPAVQLPNLVQLPQILASNGANIMQLNNMVSMAKTAASATGATTATTSASSATSAQAAQAAAAQYFLNGTVFKLQQFTTATTTTSTTAATGNVNPFNLLSTNDLQDLLIKQQQQQQQLQQLQQQQQKAAVANATATSFQEIFQQQIAAAIAANQQQQQQAQLQQLQRLGAAANIQQPVFMATPAGLLLNAASLPAMLAQAAAALAVNTQHQQQHQQQQQQQQHQQQQAHQQKAIALPALHPIQQTPLPALSSIFAPPAQQQQTAEQHELQQQHQQLAAQLALAQQQQQQQQFITATHPPPLSSVTMATNGGSGLSHNASVGGANNVSLSNSLSSQTSLVSAAAAAAVAAQNNAAKLAIVKANAAAPPTYTTLSSQPPPLVTISNAKTRTHLGTASTALTAASQKPSMLSKPYQKRSPKVSQSQAKATLTVPNPASKTSSGKITSATGKIIATPTTPPPLVPTLTPCAQPPVTLTSVPAPGIRAATATNPTKPTAMPTPALVSIAPTSTSSVGPKSAQSITCGSVTITPTSSSANAGKNLVNIAPKVAAATNTTPNMQAYKFNGKSGMASGTAAAPLSVAKTKAKTTASDLFDLVKNSNGAISITPAPMITASVSSSSISFSSPARNGFKPVVPLEKFGKIKDEPLDEVPTVAVPEAKCPLTANDAGEKEAIKHEPPTSFSGQIPASNVDIKQELINQPASEQEDSEPSCSPQPNNLLNHDCSSSSFSSHSNSVSSAADLSLEASTPASITSSSEAPSPGCSILSPINSSSNQCVVATPCSSSPSSAVDSNSSNSCETAGGASSRDMLSEMVTSTCISSDSSEASESVSLPENDEGKLSTSGDDKSVNDSEDKPRDLPTPESGIGGSLSNAESMDSSSKSSNCDISSSASSVLCDQEASSPTSLDTQTPPATPMEIETASSMGEKPSEPPTPTESSSTESPLMSTVRRGDFLMPTIDTKLAETTTAELPKSAISPILSQPKTIRFPADKGNKRQDGICYWDKCNKKHDSNSKLLDHMQQQHVNSQTGPFSCLWVGCKVYNKESCSRRWLERHVLSHGGSKQFKCIVEGCGLRFGSQLALQKHVNNHFTATENKESTNKRTSDPPVPKQLRKNGKKLRYRRQPFSARMFDFFDAGIMEGLQHRLRQISTLTNGCNSITFKGQCVMRRKSAVGQSECYVQWSPREIIADEWVPASEEPFLKTVNIRQMRPAEKNKVESLLMTAYKLPYSPTIFENDYALSQQHRTPATAGEEEQEDDSANEEEQEEDDEEASSDDDDDDDDDDEDEDEDDTTTTSAETISSYQHVLSITNLSMQQRRKHPRKPQSRIVVTR